MCNEWVSEFGLLKSHQHMGHTEKVEAIYAMKSCHNLNRI